ncbi:MAG: phenylacetic acid degradation protein, partial [Candidatus Puniceispirillaceae bacterium]
ADTAMIAAVTAAIGSYAPITTVDIASRFLRPLGAEGGDVMVEILKPGRRLVVGRITINDRASGKLAADLSSTYARL